VGEPTTHYQISLTARQAVGAFAGLLVALGLAFFFGLMAGYAGRDRVEPARQSRSSEGARGAPAGEAPPPVETGIAPGDAAKTETGGSMAAPAEPTAPATIHPFEDAAEEESAAPAPAPGGSRTTIAGSAPEAAQPKAAKAAPAPRAAAAPAGRVWVQAASLSSRDDAYALGARLSKHGFHAVVLDGSGPKGRVFRVRVGPYRSEEEATQAVTKLSHQERIREPWIVPDGK